MAYTAYSGKIFELESINTYCNKLVQAVIGRFDQQTADNHFALTGCAAAYLQAPTDNNVVPTISFITDDSDVYAYFVENLKNLLNYYSLVAYNDRIRLIASEGYFFELWKTDVALQVVSYDGVVLQSSAQISANLQSLCVAGNALAGSALLIRHEDYAFNDGAPGLYKQRWKKWPNNILVEWKQGEAAPGTQEINTTIQAYYRDDFYRDYANFRIRLKKQDEKGQGLITEFFEAKLGGLTEYSLTGNPLANTTTVDFINLGLLDAGKYSGVLVYEVYATHSVTNNEELIDTEELPVVLNVVSASAAITSPNSLTFSHTVNTSLPPSQKLMVSIPGPYSVYTAKFFTVIGTNTQPANNTVFNIVKATGPKEFDVYLNSKVNDKTDGFYEEVLMIIHEGGILRIPINLTVRAAEGIKVAPKSFYFEATKGIEEAEPQAIQISSPEDYTYVVPDWLFIGGIGSKELKSTVDPVDSAGLEAGEYVGEIKLQYPGGLATIPVTYKVNGNGYTKLQQGEINFSKDPLPINYATTLPKTYVKAKYYIAYYKGMDERHVFEHVQDIPIFEGKGSFFPGEIIHGILEKLTDIAVVLPTNLDVAVEKPFGYYRSAEVDIQLEERELVGDEVRDTVFLNNYLFQRGSSPAKFNKSVGVSLAESPTRVTRASYAMFNYYRAQGIYTIEIHKNGKRLRELFHTATQNGSYGMLLNFLEHKEGDLIYVNIKDGDNELYQKKFYLFPEGRESYHIAWESENEQLELLECTGDFTIGTNYESLENVKYSNRVDLIEILEVRKTQLVSVNTGWLLRENVALVDNLCRAKKAWLLLGDGDPIELVPQKKKLNNYDSDRALYDYGVDFKINPDNDSKVFTR